MREEYVTGLMVRAEELGKARTEDLNYGQDYWDSLDGGAGYTDSVIWEDLAHIIKELYCYDSEGNDISSGRRLVDVGCAHGWLVKHMRRRGLETFGLDISDWAISQSEPYVKEFLQSWDMTDSSSAPGFGFGTCDFLTCFETLEHIPEELVDESLKSISLLMKDGGKALLSICLVDTPGWETDPTHVTIKTRQWWVEKLNDAGFLVEQSDLDWVKSFRMFKHHPGVFCISKAA